MFFIDTNTLNDAVSLIQGIKSNMNTNFAETFQFDIKKFKAINHPNTIASIDGSHQSLKGGSFLFSVLRSGIHYYQGDNLYRSQIGRAKIEILTKENFTERHKEYFKNVTNDLPQGKIEFEKATERIRTLLEWDKVKQLVNELKRGDIILFDGSMISGVISTNKAFFDNICKQAKDKGIILAGLSKDSTITRKNVPIPKLLLNYVKENNIEGNWYVYFESEETYFVKFRRHIDLVFRLDLVLPDDVTAEEAISYIGSFCYDEGTPGYPFPLQTIHDAVRISNQQLEMTLEEFKITCMEQNISLDFINDLFEIYHNQLDIISSGR